MENNLSSWKKTLLKDFRFYLLQYALIAMVGLQFSMNFSYKVGSAMVTFIFITVLFGVLMDIGIFLRGFKPKLKILGGLLVTAGAVMQVLYIYFNITTSAAYKITLLFLLATAIVTIWSVILFFTYDQEVMTALKRKDSKKTSMYFIAEIILVFALMVSLYRYYGNQINALLASGTVNRTDGLDAAQVIGLVDAEILQVDLIQTVFLIVLSVAFFLPYRKWVVGSDRGSEGSQV